MQMGVYYELLKHGKTVTNESDFFLKAVELSKKVTTIWKMHQRLVLAKNAAPRHLPIT